MNFCRILARTAVVRRRIVILQNNLTNTVKYISYSAIMSDKFKLPARYGSGEESVWVEYLQLVTEHKPAVNLGQGFPDYPAPSHVTKALADVATSNDPLMNQYTRGYGHLKLVRAIAKLYSSLIGHPIDPVSEVLVGVGAYEILYCIIMGHIEPGEEVIVIEPFFDCYDPMIKMAGGVGRFIPLKPKTTGSSSSDWVLDEAELTSLFNDKTKLIIVNTPHNPMGKIFTRKELEFIANLCKKFNVICVADEVYEWLVYPPHKHIRMASLPGMYERTITVGSAGKSFSVTGWKIGWGYGPAKFMKNLMVVHQNCVYTCCAPIQEALARSFEIEIARFDKPDSLFKTLPAELVSKRDFLAATLKENGFKCTVPDGCYFVVVDWTPLANKIDINTEKDRYKDYRFTKKFAKECGVLAIPTSAFYSEEHKHLGENYARFCFIKKDENLQLAAKLLKEWSNKKK